MKKIDLVLALEDLGDDVEVYVEAPEEGEFEIAEVRSNPMSGTATIVAGESR